MHSVPFFPILESPEGALLPRLVTQLPESLTHTLLILNAYTGAGASLEGPRRHEWFASWLESGSISEEDLRCWIEASSFLPAFSRSRFDRARRQAEAWRRGGIWVATPAAVPAPSTPSAACPRVLFGQGDPAQPRAWIAVFNSRKPRSTPPDADWLVALRASLPLLRSQGMGLAASTGTLTYDLVAAYGLEHQMPLCLVLPFALDQAEALQAAPLFQTARRRPLLLTCLPSTASCPKPTRMVCRDRLLAFLSDIHWVLELRNGGNLLDTIRNQQRHHPRSLWVLRPSDRPGPIDGNLKLREEFPRWTGIVSKETLGRPEEVPSPPPPSPGTGYLLEGEPQEISWSQYLYHYTRSCPGPWPGQSRDEYLLSLLRGDPLSAHTALDTLIRILLEGRVRAGKKLVRGDVPVISWSSIPPGEMERIRRWNPALMRWTFEPYGLAVHRRFLVSCGTRPTIYARSALYSRLDPADRFRFQCHDPPRSNWKLEHEWRLSRDLPLEEIPPSFAFLFVPAPEEARQAARFAPAHLPIFVLRSSPATTSV